MQKTHERAQEESLSPPIPETELVTDADVSTVSTQDFNCCCFRKKANLCHVQKTHERARQDCLSPPIPETELVTVFVVATVSTHAANCTSFLQCFNCLSSLLTVNKKSTQ